MRYQGGKYHLKKYIIPFIEEYAKGKSFYLEPFLGSANIMSSLHLPIPKVGSDLNIEIIHFWTALQKGWRPPKYLTKKEYKYYQTNKDNIAKELSAFIGYGCSFGGKWWAGYVNNKYPKKNCALESYNLSLKKLEGLQNVWLLNQDFTYFRDIENCIIYCDPPYADTLTYKSNKEGFNHIRFWSQVIHWQLNNNIVLVSEFSIPPYAIPYAKLVWQKDRAISIHAKEKQIKNEKLFLFY